MEMEFEIQSKVLKHLFSEHFLMGASDYCNVIYSTFAHSMNPTLTCEGAFKLKVSTKCLNGERPTERHSYNL